MGHLLKKTGLIIVLIFIQYGFLYAQIPYLDKTGRFKWTNNRNEAFFWGVNYTTPFAHAFRQVARQGFDHKKTIDTDTYHLSRMGINAYRVHVWDCEISDSVGNLLKNDHLDLLDYLIAKFQERGVYTVLTPMAYWGNGYPEANEDLPGFSGKYNKGNIYTEPEAIAAQEKFLKQFIEHINPYTKKSYKDDPMIIAFEVCNEPGHSKAKETTDFVKKMRAAIRATGCKKPVFYNVTQSIQLLEDFIKGGIEGSTFQWYPSGLVAGFERPGNFLPHVDSYNMPFKDEKYFTKQARLVYEFDAADIGRSYIYPPMALSFKEAGMQWVTQFAYDPMPIASSNTEYQTHFLNLAYAPQKAIGFKIAGEVFQNPSYKRDRANETSSFSGNGLSVDYENDISELSTDKLFYYTNNTKTTPENPATLQSIAGYGTSTVVSYNGKGAYFLDKISESVWRLEVMPDAIWVRDPFSRATPRIENVVIKWNSNNMQVNLPDLGNQFSITGINQGNNYKTTTTDGQFTITPGAYILSAKPFTEELRQAKIGYITANEFCAPAETSNLRFQLLHQPIKNISEGQTVDLTAEVVTANSPVKSLTVQIMGSMGRGRGGFRPILIPMEKIDNYTYTIQIPDTLVRVGTFNYILKTEFESGKEIIYPGNIEGPTNHWEYYNPETYTVNVLPKESSIELLTADMKRLISYSKSFLMQYQTVPSGVSGGSVLKFTAGRGGNFPQREDGSTLIYAIENYIGEQIKSISTSADSYSQLVIHAKATEKPVNINVSLISKEGDAYTTKVILPVDQPIQTINLKDLIPGKMFLLPRPYPGFLPFWYSRVHPAAFNLEKIERIQLTVPIEGNDPAPLFEFNSVILK